MGGCDNPRMGKDILDLCQWLENIDEYPLKSAMSCVAKMADLQAGGGGREGRQAPHP
jgi:hypothetical protein